eukprot:g2647.t1
MATKALEEQRKRTLELDHRTAELEGLLRDAVDQKSAAETGAVAFKAALKKTTLKLQQLEETSGWQKRQLEEAQRRADDAERRQTVNLAQSQSQEEERQREEQELKRRGAEQEAASSSSRDLIDQLSRKLAVAIDTGTRQRASAVERGRALDAARSQLDAVSRAAENAEQARREAETRLDVMEGAVDSMLRRREERTAWQREYKRLLTIRRARDQGLITIESRVFARLLGLKSWKEWNEWSKSGQRPSNIPGCPEQVYRGKGWVSMMDFLGFSSAGKGSVKGDYLPFASARAWVRQRKMKSQKEWKEWSKSGQRPSNIPGNPWEVYRGKDWVSMMDWLGCERNLKDTTVKRDYLPFASARALVHQRKMKSKREWEEWSKSGQRPSNIPSSPEQVYRGKGWVSRMDWSG